MKIRDLEDRSRRNNRQFSGLSQAQGEDWHRHSKIKKLIKEKLGIENVEIESAHRIVKYESNEPSQKRAFIAKFLNYKDKVLQEYRSRKLWEKRLHINEDFREETMEIRKELFKQANELRKKGKFAT